MTSRSRTHGGDFSLLNVPAPRPFSPFSSSSSKRKFRGTLAMTVDVRGGSLVFNRGDRGGYDVSSGLFDSSDLDLCSTELLKLLR